MYSRHIGNILKVQKNATKHWDRHKYTEYKLKLKIEFTKVLNESSNNNKQKQLSKSYKCWNSLKVLLVYKTLWTFRPLNNKLPIQA